MIINNKLDKSFGPSAAFAGYILLVVGIATAYKGVGIIIALIGAFLGFTATGINIDLEKNRYKHYTMLLGILKVGKWENLSAIKKLSLQKSRKVFTTYSRSNRTNSFKEKSYFIYMLNANNRIKIPVKKCKTIETAKEELEKLSGFLKLPIAKA